MTESLTTSKVTNALRSAGFIAVRKTRNTIRRGYKVTRLNRRAVAVFVDHAPEGETHQSYSEKLEAALVAAGLFVARPFVDETVLGVTNIRGGGA